MKKKVLIVDDDHSLLRLSQMILSKKGYETAIAASSMEAKKMLSDDEGADVIILDLMMPNESGAGFLDWLEKQPAPLRETPVILNTAKTLSLGEVEEFSQRCGTIIAKGINFTENLLSEIESVLKE
jgi:DNA-binding NtrC family response regulator